MKEKERKWSKILQKQGIWYFPNMPWEMYSNLNKRRIDFLNRENKKVMSVSEFRKKIK